MEGCGLVLGHVKPPRPYTVKWSGACTTPQCGAIMEGKKTKRCRWETNNQGNHTSGCAHRLAPASLSACLYLQGDRENLVLEIVRDRWRLELPGVVHGRPRYSVLRSGTNYPPEYRRCNFACHHAKYSLPEKVARYEAYLSLTILAATSERYKFSALLQMPSNNLHVPPGSFLKRKKKVRVSNTCFASRLDQLS